MATAKLMRIGEVARLIGLHVSTIRNLERRGLLQPSRDWAGQRRFNQHDIAALQALAAQLRPGASALRR